MAIRQFGGSFAPPLDEDKLSRYEELAATADVRTGEAMMALCDMLRKFRETPDSAEPGTPHPSGRGIIVPLEPAEITRLWDVVPWADELDLYGKLFDMLPSGELRNAAYHLLWFGRELCADREPITSDKL